MPLVIYAQPGSTAPTCLKLTTNSDLCAISPGTISSDGFDDVCTLVDCCNGSHTASVKLQSGSTIACSNADCTNVCNLSIARSGLGIEACNTVCNPPAPVPESHPSFDGGICCGVDGKAGKGVTLGCSVNAGISTSPSKGCDVSVPIVEAPLKIPSPTTFGIPLSVGVAFCCSIGLDSEGTCELSCTDDLGVGYKGAGCSLGNKFWNAPCSALRGFNHLYLPEIPGEDHLLPPPTMCYSGGCCNPDNPQRCNERGCDPLPPPRDTLGRLLCNLSPVMFNDKVKCASKLYSCCDGGYCHPWCYVAIANAPVLCDS